MSSSKELGGGKYLYDEQKTLGRGAFGVVYLGRINDSSRKLVAVKCIDCKDDDRDSLMLVFHEATLLLTLKHDNIVQTYNCYPTESYIYLVMDFCNGGDLSDVLSKVEKLPEPVIQMFLKQIAAGLGYIHSQNIIHRDLKPQNILVHCDKASKSKDFELDEIVLKLADFGLAKQMAKNERLQTGCGTIAYMAPEIMCQSEYDSKADIWSLGVILYECMMGKLPFELHDLPNLLTLYQSKGSGGLKLAIPEATSGPLMDLLKRMLQVLPENRGSYKSVTEHPFFKASSKKAGVRLSELSTNAVGFSGNKLSKESADSTDSSGYGSIGSSSSELWKRVSVVKGDITNLKVDAIVSATNSQMNGGAGVDKAVHARGGPELTAECKNLAPCRVSEAKLTKGYKLHAKHVIHTVGPSDKNQKQLARCYANCYLRMLESGAKTIAFCCISTGILGYPRVEAAAIALSVTRDILKKVDSDAIEKVTFCCFLDEDFQVYDQLIRKKFFPRSSSE